MAKKKMKPMKMHGSEDSDYDDEMMKKRGKKPMKHRRAAKGLMAGM